MKLCEIAGIAPDFSDAYDTLDVADEIAKRELDPGGNALQGPREKRKSPSKSSNVEKAKRIRNRARMKVRKTVADQNHTDTPHQYNLGGHTSSSFLNKGPHG